MQAVLYIDGQIGKGTNENGDKMISLVDVISQFKAFESPEKVLVKIDSVGGSVPETEKIFDYLNGLKKNHTVNTEAKKAYSSAAKLFSLGEKREVEDIEKALMIHLPWGKFEGTAEEFEAVAVSLRKHEGDFSEYYSTFLEIEEAVAMDILKNDTYFSGEEAVAMGFATGIKKEFEAVALYEKENKSNKKKMTHKKSKNKEFANALIKAVEERFSGGEVNALVLQDSDAKDIDFPDVEEGELPKVDDRAEIDGSAIKDGSYIMPSMEGSTLVFVGGVITEIIEKEVEEEIQAKEKAGKKALEVKAEEIQQISVWTMEVINTSFAEGDVVRYKDWDDEEQTLGSGEFQIPDGRRVVTDATGVIVKIKEAAETKDIEVDVEASVKKAVDSIADKVQSEYKERFEKQEREIQALKKITGSKEIKIEARTTEEVSKPKGLIHIFRQGVK